MGYLFLVLSPGLAVLPAAPGDVPHRTVYDHHHEEDKVKPRERAPGTLVSVSFFILSQAASFDIKKWKRSPLT
jgi:hypothetical protein